MGDTFIRSPAVCFCSQTIRRQAEIKIAFLLTLLVSLGPGKRLCAMA